MVRERVIRVTGACRPLGAYSFSINVLNTNKPSFTLLTSGVRSGIRRRKLPGEPMKNGDSTRRPDDGGRQTGSSGRDGWNPEAQPAVHQRHGTCSSNPNSPGIFGACLWTTRLLPSSMRKEVLEELYDRMGHQGIDRVDKLVRARFYWPNLRSDIHNWIAMCGRCNLAKMPHFKVRTPMHSIAANEPLEVVAIASPDTRTR